jgi:hypothetical protein
MSSNPSVTKSMALTTIFTPSPSCLSDYYVIHLPEYDSLTSSGYVSLGPPTTSACLPLGWEVTSQYFSPGLCPSGYKIACSILNSIGSITETQAICCPSGYLCQTTTKLYFYSTHPCTIRAQSLPAVITVTSTNNSTTSTYTTKLCSG